MEKTIKLVMETNGAIKIYVNNEQKHIIVPTLRTITAKEIYDIIGFKIEDSYSVVAENNYNIDIDALELFKNLFEEIVKKVNAQNN